MLKKFNQLTKGKESLKVGKNVVALLDPNEWERF